MAQPQGLRGGRGLLDTNMWGSENDTHGMNTTFHIETEENSRHIIFPLQRRPDITPSVWIGLQPLASRRCWQTLCSPTSNQETHLFESVKLNRIQGTKPSPSQYLCCCNTVTGLRSVPSPEDWDQPEVSVGPPPLPVGTAAES